MERKKYVDIIEYTKRGMYWKVKELIEKGENVNEQNTYGDYAVVWAAMRGDMKTLKILVDGGARLDVVGHMCSPLDYAKMNKDEQMVQYLKDKMGK